MTFQAVGHGAVFSDVAADDVRCTGILEGIAPMPASTKAGLERVVDDVAPLASAIVAAVPLRRLDRKQQPRARATKPFTGD